MSEGFWNDDKVEALKKLWADGLSGSQIGARLGTGRGAVIGKAHRLGLSSRGNIRKPPRPRQHVTRAPPSHRYDNIARLHAANGNQPPAPPPEPYEPLYREIDVPVAERKRLIDLEPGDCRWPIGDPRHADFHFCNQTRQPGQSYCTFHISIAFQAPEPRRPHPATPRREKVPTFQEMEDA